MNTLIPSGSGWELAYATGINDLGQIVGYGEHDGQYRAYLLTPTTPVPEPSAVGLVGFAFLAAMRRFRRRGHTSIMKHMLR